MKAAGEPTLTTTMPSLAGAGRWRDLLTVVLGGIGVAAAAGVAALATREIFGALHGREELPIRVLVLLGLAGVAIAGFRIISRVAGERMGHSYAMAVRSRLFGHLSRMTYSVLSEKRTGALGLRFVGDLTALRAWVGRGIPSVLSAVVILPGAALALYLLNPALALATVVPLAGAIAAMLLIAGCLAPVHRQARSRRARISIGMIERVAVAPELHLMGRTGKEMRQLDADGAILREHGVRRVLFLGWLRAIPELGAALAGVSVLWTASGRGIPAAEAAGALAVLGILALPLRDLAHVWDRYCAWRIAKSKLLGVLAKPAHAGRRRKRGGKVGIAFRNVRFRGLTIDMTIEPGEKVCVEGPVGSGKSAILALATGLEIPEWGSVEYLGRELLPKTAYVGPHSPILQGSLRRALTLGVSPRPADDVIERAAREVGLGAVLGRSEGLDQRVGERGRNLSAGEVARVLVTRAKLSKADLLVIDLPLPERDAALKAALTEVVKNTQATVLVSSLSVADLPSARALKIDAGRVIARRPI